MLTHWFFVKSSLNPFLKRNDAIPVNAETKAIDKDIQMFSPQIMFDMLAKNITILPTIPMALMFLWMKMEN